MIHLQGGKRLSVKDHLALIFNQAVHFEGRKQVPLSTLVVGGLRPSEIALAVQFGWLKQGVQGYWLPEPTDPGFLSVVNSIAMTSDRDDPWPDCAGLNAGDVDRHAKRGRLADRFGKD